MTTTKTRPLVDSKCYDLAEAFLSDRHLTDAESRVRSKEDATWDLSDAIQSAIEDWLAYEEEEGHLESES